MAEGAAAAADPAPSIEENSEYEVDPSSLPRAQTAKEIVQLPCKLVKNLRWAALGSLHTAIYVWTPVQNMAAHFEMAGGPLGSTITHHRNRLFDFREF